MSDPTEPPQDVIKAALDLVAEHGWSRLTLTAVANRAGVPLDALYDWLPGKPAILAALGRSIDRAVLAGGPVDPADHPRDRLFEAMMRRFDALTPYRAGIAVLLRELPADPAVALCQAARLRTAMRWTLEVAGIPSGGPLGELKIKALGVIHLLVLRVWLKDDTADLSRTMAALDRRLNQAEQLVNTFDRRRGKTHATAPAQTESAGNGDGEPASPDGPLAPDGGSIH